VRADAVQSAVLRRGPRGMLPTGCCPAQRSAGGPCSRPSCGASSRSPAASPGSADAGGLGCQCAPFHMKYTCGGRPAARRHHRRPGDAARFPIRRSLEHDHRHRTRLPEANPAPTGAADAALRRADVQMRCNPAGRRRAGLWAGAGSWARARAALTGAGAGPPDVDRAGAPPGDGAGPPPRGHRRRIERGPVYPAGHADPGRANGTTVGTGDASRGRPAVVDRVVPDAEAQDPVDRRCPGGEPARRGRHDTRLRRCRDPGVTRGLGDGVTRATEAAE
jgi:hypothetical protein